MRQINRRRFLVLAAGTAAGAGGGWSLARSRGGWATVTRRAKALGSEVSLTVRHPQIAVAERAIAAAFDELALVERLMSIYRPDSELSRLNEGGELRNPHPHFVAVLRAAQQTSRDSRGAFDVSVQPLWEVFAAAQKQDRLPAANEIAAARELVDWRQIETADDCVRLLHPGMRLTLNGIAQGFATDRVLSALQDHGIEHALINAGELNSLGQSERGGAWRVGIQHPRQSDAFIALADLDGRALATSGDYNTRFSADGHHNHILDPRSGYSPTEVASASVLAPTAVQADALSTAMFVLGPDKGLALASRQPGVDLFSVLKNGETLATAGFPLRTEGSAA